MTHTEVFLTDLAFGESPRWHEGQFWVADWGAQEILSTDGEGRKEVAIRVPLPSFQPICFDWLPDGPMIIVSSAAAVLLRREPHGTLARHADLGAIGRNW